MKEGRKPLDPEVLAQARIAWETSPRWGAQWLIDLYALPVTKSELLAIAKEQGWEKFRERFSATIPAEHLKDVMDNHHGITDEETHPDDGAIIGKYDPKFRKQAYKMALLGMAAEDIADSFDVNVSTLRSWMERYPEFGAAIKKGRAIADAKVSHALYKRATGFEIMEYKTNVVEGVVEVTPVPKRILGDVAAQKFWLINRQPHLWKERVEVKEQMTIDLGPSKEELDAIYAAAEAKIREQNESLRARIERFGILAAQGAPHEKQ